MLLPVAIPLGVLDASAKFAVLDADFHLVSEHHESGAACGALIEYILRTKEDGVIVERTANGWVEH